MKTYSVTILPEAIEQFHEIILYIKQWSPQSARKLASDVFNRISKLNTSPRRYSKEVYSNSLKEIRSFTYKNVKVIYLINQKEVIILAILHGNRNPLIIADISPE